LLLLIKMQMSPGLSTVSSPASGCPDYSGFTDSIHIPFTSEDAPGVTPAIDIEVNGKLIAGAGLDSGSTVFALSDELVPGFAEADQSKLSQGSVSYTNGRVWDGYWFRVSVTFEGTERNTATSEIDVLVVTKQTYHGKREYDTIHYIGIAFGIIDPKSGYTPDKNPLLAVTQYNNKPIDDSTFRRGYIMSKRSIDVGLTGKNTESFKCTKLTNSSSLEAKWYWDRVSLALRVNDSDWMQGDALTDTGLTDMEIASPQYKGNHGPLPHGTDVAMRFPDENTSLPEFSFRWPGNNESWLPASVYYYKSRNTKAFVNTGQNFYYKFDTLFDADKGFWGVREI
jgi:hypothetical protein